MLALSAEGIFLSNKAAKHVYLAKRGTVQSFTYVYHEGSDSVPRFKSVKRTGL